MHKKIRLIVLTAFAATAFMAVAGPAAAEHCDFGRFCAFDLINYGHPQLLASNAPAGSNPVGIATDDETASAKNRTSDLWCGVSSEGWPDETVFSFANNTWYTTLGSANNTIDHFYVRSSNTHCD